MNGSKAAADNHSCTFSEVMSELNSIKSDVYKIRKDVKTLHEVNRNTEREIASTVLTNKEGWNNVKPIGILQSVFKELNGIPRQPGLCKNATAFFTIDKEIFNNPEHSLQDIEQFSHIWLIFVFHLNKNVSTKAKVKPPRMNGAKTGVFSTRSPYRPNPIGLSLVKLVDVKGSTLYLSGIDLVDGTPILDIKPYLPYSDNPHLRETDEKEGLTSTDINCTTDNNANTSVANWLDQNEIGNMTVRFTPTAECSLQNFTIESKDEKFRLESYKDSNELKEAIIEILKNDPRSAYRRKKCSDRLYYMNIDIAHITCWFDDNVAEVLAIKSNKN